MNCTLKKLDGTNGQSMQCIVTPFHPSFFSPRCRWDSAKNGFPGPAAPCIAALYKGGLPGLETQLRNPFVTSTLSKQSIIYVKPSWADIGACPAKEKLQVCHPRYKREKKQTHLSEVDQDGLITLMHQSEISIEEDVMLKSYQQALPVCQRRPWMH